MCLTVVYKGKQKKEALARLPDEFWGWRYCEKIGDRYYPILRECDTRLKAGINIAIKQEIGFSPYSYKCKQCTRIQSADQRYKSGFHFMLTRKDADYWIGSRFINTLVRRMRCRIKKEYITAIGKQDEALCIVVSQARFPKYCK